MMLSKVALIDGQCHLDAWAISNDNPGYSICVGEDFSNRKLNPWHPCGIFPHCNGQNLN